MALSRNNITALIIAAIIIVVLLITVYLFRCSIFKSLSSCVQPPDKANKPLPPTSPTSKWVPESFPLNVGMYGPKTKALQKAMGFQTTDPKGKNYADGYFGDVETKPAVIAKGYSVPLSMADYNKIVGTSGSGSSSGSGKTLSDYEGTFINTGNTINTTVRYIADSSTFKTYGKNENIGTLGSDLGNGYHRIFGVSGYDDSFGSGLKIADAQLKIILGIK